MTPSDEDCARLAPEWLAAVARSGPDSEAAAHRLFKCFYRGIVRFLAFRYSFDELTSEEIAQTAFIKGFKAAGGFRRRSAVYTWLLSIAINSAKDYIKKEKRRPDGPSASTQDRVSRIPDQTSPLDESSDGADTLQPCTAEPGVEQGATEEAEALQACIDRQFALFYVDYPECGEAFRRFYFDGWSSKELAAARGKSDDAMRTELKSCRNKLRTYCEICQEFRPG